MLLIFTVFAKFVAPDILAVPPTLKVVLTVAEDAVLSLSLKTSFPASIFVIPNRLLSPKLILPPESVIWPSENVSVPTVVPLSKLAAVPEAFRYIVSACSCVNLESNWVWILPVIPLIWLNSVEVTVVPDNKFKSSALAVNDAKELITLTDELGKLTPPIFIVSTERSPTILLLAAFIYKP